MLPEEASKSAAAKDAAPFVEPSAAALVMESVLPENESGEETVVAWTAPVAVEERSEERIPETVRLVVLAVVAVMAVVEAYGKVLAAVAVEVKVEVALIAPPKKEVPEMYELPWTERRWEGEVEPKPRNPLELSIEERAPLVSYISMMFADWDAAGTIAKVVVAAAPESTDNFAYGVEDAPTATRSVVVDKPMLPRLSVVQPPPEDAPPDDEIVAHTISPEALV